MSETEQKVPTQSKYYLGAYRDVTRFRILSLDGAGIYGLTEALLLKKLCDGNKKFLTEEQPIALFAGCSAGAINALLMAKYDRPRDAIDSGEMERFWQEAGLWSIATDWWGFPGILTPQASSHAAKEQFKRYFGDRTLADLKQNVLISTFAWSGMESLPGVDSIWTEGEAPPPPSPLACLWELWFPWLKGWLPPPPPPQPTPALWEKYYKCKSCWVTYEDPDPMAPVRVRHDNPEGISTDTYRHWQPRMIKVSDNNSLGITTEGLPPEIVNSIEKNPDKKARVTDVAWAAAAPPGIRELLYGLGDGASFTANPAPYAYSEMMQFLRWNVFNWDLGVSDPEKDAPSLLPLVGKRKSDGKERWTTSEKLLGYFRLPLCAHSAISMLSVGDGSSMPYLWPPNNNFGSMPFYTWLPSNLWRGSYYPPLAYMLQPANEAADNVMQELLGWKYCRLNPAIMEMPTIVACLLCFNPCSREWVIRTIRERMADRVTKNAIRLTLGYLEDDTVWATNKIPLPMPLGPCQNSELLEGLGLTLSKLEEKLDEVLKRIYKEGDRVPPPDPPFSELKVPGAAGNTIPEVSEP